MQVAGFPAGTAIINAVLTQTDLIQALAEAAILVTGAASFRVIADHAHEFPGHSGRLARFGGFSNGTMVGDPVVSGRQDRPLPGLQKTPGAYGLENEL